MADTFQLYGKTNGKIVFVYGPKNFSADWGGVFKAFDVANMATKRSKGALGTSSAPMRRIGKIVERANLRMWVQRLEAGIISLKLERIHINAVDKNLIWPDKILPSQLISFAGYDAPAEPLLHGLIRMGLNRWGVVQELTDALSMFDAKVAEGSHTAIAHITV